MAGSAADHRLTATCAAAMTVYALFRQAWPAARHT
jgi:hypothetical protein